MSNGLEVGGDGSVAWRIQVGYARRSEVFSKSDGYSLTQGGVDETESGKMFTVGVKVPRENAGDFVRSLYAAAKDAEAHASDPGYSVKFELPIEPNNRDQIQVHWESAKAPESKPSLMSALKKKLKKKVGTLVAAKKPAAKKAAAKGKKRAGKKKKR